jgi:predicted dehydrogenase
MEQRHQATAALSADSGQHYNFVRQAEEFADAILADRAPLVSGQDGLKALEICLAIYRSAAQGCPVTLASAT